MARPAPDRWQARKDQGPDTDGALEGQVAPATKDERRSRRPSQQPQPSKAEPEDAGFLDDEEEAHDHHQRWESGEDDDHHVPTYTRADNDDAADIAPPPQSFTPDAPRAALQTEGGSYGLGYIAFLIALALIAASVSAAVVLIFF